MERSCDHTVSDEWFREVVLRRRQTIVRVARGLPHVRCRHVVVGRARRRSRDVAGRTPGIGHEWRRRMAYARRRIPYC